MIIAVDFDDTLCQVGTRKPNFKLLRRLCAAKKQGDKIILWTCREGSYLQSAVEFCAQYGLLFDAVNCNVPEMQNKPFGKSKIYADQYIDDRSALPDPF